MVERSVNRREQQRVIVNRFDKGAVTYSAAVVDAALVLWPGQ